MVKVLLALFLIGEICLGQSVVTKKIKGQIVVDGVFSSAVKVVNTSSLEALLSDEKGFFFISVVEGDVLMFSSLDLELLRKKINRNDLENGLVKIELFRKQIDLDEVVVVKNNKISAESLGIVPAGQIKLSSAERKLYTATSGGGIDGLLNSISGRKAMLKKEIIVEKKEVVLSKLEFIFEDKYYLETLHIPLEYIKGFQYYCVDDLALVDSVLAKNKVLTSFLIINLAQKYKRIIDIEAN
jgi:hypothetical protein